MAAAGLSSRLTVSHLASCLPLAGQERTLQLPWPMLSFLLPDTRSVWLPLKGSLYVQLLLPALPHGHAPSQNEEERWLYAPWSGGHMLFLWPVEDRTQGLRAADWGREVPRASVPLVSTPTLRPAFSRSRRPGLAPWAAATTTTWTRSAPSWCRVRRTECSYSVS